MSSNNKSSTVPEDLLKQMMEIEPDEDIMSCQNCLYYSGRMDRFGRNCRLRSCMCIDERLSFGLVDYKELFLDLIHKFKNKAFSKRALNMIFAKEFKPVFFMNNRHETVFFSTMSSYNYFDQRQAAIVYLLTASQCLWEKVGIYLNRNGMDFDRIHLSDCPESDYTLYKAAKNLYYGESISINDLTDQAIVPKPLFAVICIAYSIRFYGVAVLRFVKE